MLKFPNGFAKSRIFCFAAMFFYYICRKGGVMHQLEKFANDIKDSGVYVIRNVTSMPRLLLFPQNVLMN